LSEYRDFIPFFRRKYNYMRCLKVQKTET